MSYHCHINIIVIVDDYDGTMSIVVVDGHPMKRTTTNNNVNVNQQHDQVSSNGKDVTAAREGSLHKSARPRGE